MRKINPPNLLKNKIGSGGIPPHLLERAEQLIKENDNGFEDYVYEQIAKLAVYLNIIKSQEELDESDQHNLLLPILTLKAHGSMFGYQLITDISNEALHLIEHIDRFNEDVMDILQVFSQTAKVIVDKGLKADGGPIGAQLVTELNAACERYFSKY